ncbi:hypothetical protein [Sphingomonas phage Kimi]|nr:hypothetical protein [Sphingomonas phage Kimi]
MVADKQDANLVGFYKARETSLGQLPAVPYWLTREPNSFDDLGGEYTKVARRPFSPSRQRKKGAVTDLDADGGYNEDVTQNNMQGELEEFFFAHIRALPNASPSFAPYAKVFTVNASTDVATTNAHGLATGDGPFYVSSTTTLPDPLAVNTPYWVTVTGVNSFKFATSRANAVAAVPVNIDLIDTGTGAHTMTKVAAVAGATKLYRFNNVPAAIKVGDKVLAKGYSNNANNGVKTVTAVTAFTVEVAEVLADEDTPPYGASLKLFARPFAAGDLALTVAPGTFTITATAGSFQDFAPVPGSWLFIGGDADDTSFEDDDGNPNPGYARIANNGVSANFKALTFDKSTFVPEAQNGAGLTVIVYFGDVLKNEDDPDLIARFSSTIERTLGRDDDGIQSEYLTGAIASEMTWNSPLANLVNVDLAYIAQKANTRKGVDGPLSRRVGNVILKALGEDAFNTSSNIYRLRLAPVDPDTLNPMPVFARVTEWSLTINNNVSAAKAQGVLGAFDATVGNFDVDGEFTAYFSTVEAIHAVQCNYDMTFDAIYAKGNAGIVLDVPLIGLGGGRLDIEQDAAIMLPLETAAAESPFGHTALIQWFPYLPNVGMPDVDC